MRAARPRLPRKGLRLWGADGSSVIGRRAACVPNCCFRYRGRRAACTPIVASAMLSRRAACTPSGSFAFFVLWQAGSLHSTTIIRTTPTIFGWRFYKSGFYGIVVNIIDHFFVMVTIADVTVKIFHHPNLSSAVEEFVNLVSRIRLPTMNDF